MAALHLSVWHILILLATVALVIGTGFYVGRSVRSADSYSLNGRSAGPWLVAGSIAGTVVGGGSTVGTAQFAFSFGLSAWWFTLGAGLAFCLMGLFYAKRLRRTNLTTIPQYLSLHYGKRAEEAAGIISSVGILFSAVASCIPGIEIIAALFRISAWQAALVLILLVAGYTFFGGMKSAGVGGILKMAIIWISLAIAGGSAAYSLWSLPTLGVSFPASAFNLFGQGGSTALANLLALIVGVFCTQTYIQAVFSAAKPAVASLGCFVAALIVIPVGLPSVSIGMYMHYFAPQSLPVLVLPLYLTEHQPVLVAGVALGGIMLSLIGSIGGLSLGIGTMVSHDILSPLLGIREDKKLLRLTRASVLGVMVVACGIAIVNQDTEVLFWNYLSMGLRGGGIFLPLTLAVFWPGHVKAVWVVISMLGSTVAAMLASTVIPLPFDPLFAGLLVSLALLVPGLRWQKQPLLVQERRE